MSRILVSQCLLGCPCRYSGDGMENSMVIQLQKDHQLIPVCPEQLGGLPTPRAPSEIVGERVVNIRGQDVTDEYRRGAEISLQVAKENKVDFCIMKAKSPSCGCGQIHDGTFTGGLIEGDGFTTRLLKENGYEVFTENDSDEWPLANKTD